MTITAAPAGTTIIVLDRGDRTFYHIPVVAFDVQGTIAYPIAATAFGGLLKGVRALNVNGLIADRGFDIPFDSVDAWVQWAMNTTPGAESEAYRHSPGATDTEGDPAALAAKHEATVIHASVHEETGPEKAARLRAANAGKPLENADGTPKPDIRPRKTFASKSFWSRPRMDGMQEIVEIEPGHGLPRDSEGFEKIKRDEYAAFKKLSKGDDATVIVIAWDNGPVIPDDAVDPDEIVEPRDDDGDDFGGLV